DGMMRFLVDQYRKRGELDALRARAAELQAVPATRTQGEKLEALVAERARDWRFLAQAAEKKNEERAKRQEKPQASLHYDAAQRWLRAGEVEKALAHLRIVLDFDSPGLREAQLPVPHSGYELERVYYGTQPPQGGTTNPFAFSFGGGSSYSSYGYISSWRRGGGSVGYRSLAAAALRRAGDAAKAQEVEDALLEETRPSQRREVAGRIAQTYVEAALWHDAVRIWRWCLARADEFKLEEKDKAAFYAQIFDALRRADAPQAEREPVLAEWRRSLEAAIAAAPGPHAFQERAALASYWVEILDDPEPAAAELDWLLRYDPNNVSW